MTMEVKEMFVIAYYGSLHTQEFGHHGWNRKYIGEGIVHESEPLSNYPDSKMIGHFTPKDKEFKYAQIEKRFYSVPQNIQTIAVDTIGHEDMEVDVVYENKLYHENMNNVKYIKKDIRGIIYKSNNLIFWSEVNQSDR